MFIDAQSGTSKEYYEKMLKVAGSLSNLFSESPQPYLGYRLVENLFCKTFNAENLSRSDCSVDASKNKSGVGLKTFLYKNGKSYEKVAEFNREMNIFANLDHEAMVQKVAELRNQRISFTKRTYDLNSMIYHCVVRNIGKILVYETPMSEINTGKISNMSVSGNVISFKDDLSEYKFNIAKSTLFKKFVAEDILMDFGVKIITNPFEAIERMFENSIRDLAFSPIREQPHVFLPLYSGNAGEKLVREKSGLNQWNGGGRRRDPNEIYIPIPAWIHHKYPGFFPPRDTSFNLLLPNGARLQAKVCQDGSKALTSKHNPDLGKWLLRDVMNIKEGDLLTYEKLETIGLDSVVIYKKSEDTFDIDFAKIGSYEQFSGNSDLLENQDD